MALNWKSVKSEHIAQACELLLRGEHKRRTPPKGIFVSYKDSALPAKHVLRLGYCIANNIPPSTALKFSSGDGTIKLLRSLGFEAGRQTLDRPAD